MKLSPIKFGLYGGISFGIGLTIWHYISNKIFSFVWLFGGFLVFFLTIFFISKFFQKNNK